MKIQKIWKIWLDLFEEKEDEQTPHFDPVHLASVLTLCLVVIGIVFWILWTLLVYEGGLLGEGWRANVVALGLVVFIVALLYKADRRHAQKKSS